MTSFSNALLKDVVNVGGNIAVMQGDSSSISLGYDLHLGHEFSRT